MYSRTVMLNAVETALTSPAQSGAASAIQNGRPVPGAVWQATGIGGLLRSVFFALGLMAMSFGMLIIPVVGRVLFPFGIIF